MSKSKHSITLFLVTFLFLYTPPIFSVNILHFIAVISYIVLIYKYLNVFKSFLQKKSTLILIYGTLFAITLLLINILSSRENYLNVYGIIIIIIEVLPISLLISIQFNKYGYNFEDIVILILNIALLQSIIAVLMFLLPSFKQFIINTFYEHYYQTKEMSYWVKYRVFGFSSGMLYAMPITQGFLAALAFLFSIKKSLKYLVYIPLLLFSAVINARTGIIVFLINVVIIIMLNYRKMKISNIKRIVFVSVILFLSISIFILFIESESKVISTWIMDGYNETMNFIKGERTGYFKAVSDMLFLPDLETIIFGSGKDYFYNKYDKYSTDIGYINDLFLGGVFYEFIMYISILQYLFTYVKKANWETINISFMIVTTMLITNIKGYAFRQNEFLNLFILLSTILHYYNYKKQGRIN